MDEKERTIRFREISEKHSIEASNDFEKREHVFKIVMRFTMSTLVICWSITFIGLVFSLDWLILVAIALSIIFIIILTISLMYSSISMNKTDKKWKEYLEEIDNLFAIK